MNACKSWIKREIHNGMLYLLVENNTGDILFNIGEGITERRRDLASTAIRLSGVWSVVCSVGLNV